MWEAIAGGLSSFANTAYNNYMAADRQEDMQGYNAEQSAIDRGWRQQMRATQYQTAVEDLKLAGLNPMLAYTKGGDTPSGGAASSSTASPGGGESPAAGMQAGSAAAVNNLMKDRVIAETDKLKAEADEVRARTPTHATHIQSMEQQIDESKNRIQKIIQEVKTGGATELNIQQQTANLRELIPQIKATIQNIKAQTAYTSGAQTALAGAQSAQAQAQAGLAGEQTGEVKQRVKENLPQLEAALKELERQAQKLLIPGREAQADTQTGYMGALSNTLRALNPFSDFIRAR